jgi:hypothetical protein
LGVNILEVLRQNQSGCTKINAYIVTKPLQILIAKAIKDQLNPEYHSYLIVIDYFNNSKSVYENLKNEDWGYAGIYWASDKNNAIEYIRKIKAHSVFVDSDIGVRNLFFLTRVKLVSVFPNIYVYEEGMGTYRTDLYSKNKSFFLRLFGVATYFGASILTAGIFVYEPGRYLSLFPAYNKICNKIEKNLAFLIEDRKLNLQSIFDDSGAAIKIERKSKECSVYLSSWSVDKTFLDKFQNKIGDKYVKLHPHIKKYSELGLKKGIQQLPSALPAEIVLLNLSKVYDRVVVYHHGSGVSLYLSSNVFDFKDMGYFNVP